MTMLSCILLLDLSLEARVHQESISPSVSVLDGHEIEFVIPGLGERTSGPLCTR